MSAGAWDGSCPCDLALRDQALDMVGDVNDLAYSLGMHCDGVSRHRVPRKGPGDPEFLDCVALVRCAIVALIAGALSMLGDLLISIGVWLVYFSVIFFPLRWVYDRVVGPRPSDRMADRERFDAWAARQTRLRRMFIAAGIGLAVLPLVIRMILAVSKATGGG